MKKLAEAMGAPLYNYTNRQILFTDIGLELVKTAVEVLDSFSRLDMAIGNIKGFKSGTLRMAVVTTSKYFIPHLLGPFLEKYPVCGFLFDTVHLLLFDVSRLFFPYFLK